MDLPLLFLGDEGLVGWRTDLAFGAGRDGCFATAFLLVGVVYFFTNVRR
ncbi:hypothetical protein M917_2273 [Psychrobacter aquaticus CMS 56]|uniref:Uncharacterized protein n=1 Tax=Psychrobacter aquaticus CMS 56 TaxID=1354303 RepID=U4T222_9GAMM|nr:hypothetical protein M917_2273 [Psychrobacter aquaticus CMS 56]